MAIKSNNPTFSDLSHR